MDGRRMRLISEHFKRDGTPKRPFASHGDAERERLRSGKASSYKCKFCGAWHVGGVATPRQQAQGSAK